MGTPVWWATVGTSPPCTTTENATATITIWYSRSALGTPADRM